MKYNFQKKLVKVYKHDTVYASIETFYSLKNFKEKITRLPNGALVFEISLVEDMYEFLAKDERNTGVFPRINLAELLLFYIEYQYPHMFDCYQLLFNKINEYGNSLRSIKSSYSFLLPVIKSNNILDIFQEIVTQIAIYYYNTLKDPQAENLIVANFKGISAIVLLTRLGELAHELEDFHQRKAQFMVDSQRSLRWECCGLLSSRQTSVSSDSTPLISDEETNHCCLTM